MLPQPLHLCGYALSCCCSSTGQAEIQSGPKPRQRLCAIPSYCKTPKAPTFPKLTATTPNLLAYPLTPNRPKPNGRPAGFGPAPGTSP